MPIKLEYEKMKTRRIEIDMTQKELSSLTGVNLNVIKAIETGRTMTDKENVRKMADVLGFAIEEIYKEDFRDTKVISVINNKGGCGKTSVCGSLGFTLAELGNRILLIDADAQRNLSSSFGMSKSENHFGKAIVKEESLMNNYIVKTQYPNIDFIVSDVSMGTLDMLMFTKMHRENVLKQILNPVVEAGLYDFILIDTNPNLSILNFNVVNASDYTLVPVQLASFDLEGISTVLDFIKGIQKFNTKLEILGIIINKYDIRNKSITQQAEEQLRAAYDDLILKTIIKIDVKIQNAQWENKPVLAFDSNSRIAKEYRELAKEVLKRC